MSRTFALSPLAALDKTSIRAKEISSRTMTPLLPSTNKSALRLRLAFCHNGIDHYDKLFLDRFASEFETYLLTFLPPVLSFKRVRVIQLPDFGKTMKIRKLNNIRIAIGTLWRIIQLRRYLSSIKPDISIGNWVTTYGLYASICRQKPFVLFAYGSDIIVDPHRSFLHRLITARVIESADILLIDSEVQRRSVLALGCSPSKIVSFPWVNLDDLKEITADRTIRKRLKWQSKIVVVCVRKHEPIYSVDTLIRAIPLVLAKRPDVRFLIFGQGAQTRLLIQLAKELKVTGAVSFAGNVPRTQLLRYVKDCDVYVTPSLSDGCSSSLLEAMTLDTPVVVSSIPGNAEWISDGHNGVMFKPRDPTRLANAILRVVTNPQEAREYAHRASKEVRDRVDWRLASRELIERMYQAYATYEKTSHGQKNSNISSLQ